MKKINLILIFLFGFMTSMYCFAEERHIYNRSNYDAYVRISNDSVDSSSISINGKSCSTPGIFTSCKIPSNGYADFYLPNGSTRLLYSLESEFPSGYIGDRGNPADPNAPWRWIGDKPKKRTSQVFVCNDKLSFSCYEVDGDPYDSFQILEISNHFTDPELGDTDGDVYISNK